MRLWTVGHSTRSGETLIELLAAAGIDLVADVRAYPRSRRHPQFNAETLEPSLARAGIGYRHFAGLGGRRRAGQLAMPSPNRGWRVEGFRNYADYALTVPFQEALAALRDEAAARPTAVMCAERHPSQCHRRIITDYLLAAGDTVLHLLDAGQSEPAQATPWAKVENERRIHYPPDQAELF